MTTVGASAVPVVDEPPDEPLPPLAKLAIVPRSPIAAVSSAVEPAAWFGMAPEAVSGATTGAVSGYRAETGVWQSKWPSCGGLDAGINGRCVSLGPITEIDQTVGKVKPTFLTQLYMFVPSDTDNRRLVSTG